MKVLIAIDSFKGSLSSLEAGKAIKEGIQEVMNAEVTICPIADGGEGTVEALSANGELKKTMVTGPLGNKVLAKWAIINANSQKTAVIEMAEAAGIALLKREELNPLNTTTYGVGELIKEAINEGCLNFVIGIGGSSTNDGGTGMLKALGYSFLDKDNKEIELGAKGLKDLYSISDTNVIKELNQCTFKIACDVKNPLCGINGCSAIYGPQKGADEKMIKEMDEWLLNYATISKGDKDYPGTGAAGGMGYAFKTFLNADLEPGIDIVLNTVNLEEKVKDVDIVITGEGRMDKQTVMGKAPSGVSKIAKKYNKKVIAFCGCASDEADICNEYGIDAYFPILRKIASLEEALNKDNAYFNLKSTAKQVFNLIK
ncbi:MAG: glycerate kinase [Erysipelotrichaceae bacterium]|nr:glycerate kinase [Erysipelotrichaceae bacterium]